MLAFTIKSIALWASIRKTLYMDSIPKGVVVLSKDGLMGLNIISGTQDTISVIKVDAESQVFIDDDADTAFDARPIMGSLSIWGDTVIECRITKKKITFVDTSNKKNKASCPLFSDRWVLKAATRWISEIDKKDDFVFSLPEDDYNKLCVSVNFCAKPEKLNLHGVWIEAREKTVSFIALDGFMMSYMWKTNVITGNSDYAFFSHPKLVNFNAYKKVTMYKTGKRLTIQHGDHEFRIASIGNVTFPHEQVKQSLANDEIDWCMILKSDHFLERINAVASIDYQQHANQIRVRTEPENDTVMVESIDSLAAGSVSHSMDNLNNSKKSISFVLLSKYAKSVMSYLKLGSESFSNVVIGSSGKAIIVFGNDDMEGRFGFARVHDIENKEATA